jgi:hypothetical protein
LLNFPIAITSSDGEKLYPSADGFITNVVTPADSVNEIIAVPSIKLPLQNIVKLFTDVAGKPDGAVNQPLAKVTVVLLVYVPVFCMLVFK